MSEKGERRQEAESRCAACDQPHAGERRYEPWAGLGWHDFQPPNHHLIAKRVVRSLRREGLIR